MTQDKNHNSENRNWMEIAETDAINDVRHNGQRLPFIAAAVSLLIIGGGAVFSSTVSDPAVSSPSAAVSSVGAPAMSPGGIPVIPNVAPGVGGYDDEDDDEDDDDDDEYDDDDDHRDDDHDEDEDDD